MSRRVKSIALLVALGVVLWLLWRWLGLTPARRVDDPTTDGALNAWFDAQNPNLKG